MLETLTANQQPTNYWDNGRPVRCCTNKPTNH